MSALFADYCALIPAVDYPCVFSPFIMMFEGSPQVKEYYENKSTKNNIKKNHHPNRFSILRNKN